MDRIEKVKQKLLNFSACGSGRVWDRPLNELLDMFAKQIDGYYSQPFPQPLDDKGLREKIKGAINASVIIHSFKHDDWSIDADKGADQILALLQQHYHPSIEAQKLQIELAIRQERERIIGCISEYIYSKKGGVHILITPYAWQALKECK